jgi:imidazolonepropionase
MEHARPDLFIRNAAEIATLRGGTSAPLTGATMADAGIIEDGFLAVADGRVQAVGPMSALDDTVDAAAAKEVVDTGRCIVTPGFVDPHTHALFAGRREDEFYLRISGTSYLEIARRGGGIGRTVADLRATDSAVLYEIGKRHLDTMVRQGTTTVEIKSGYGLTVSDEIRMLEVIERLGRDGPSTVVATFLGAHATPPEYRDRPDAYLDLVVAEMLPIVAERSLARYCDAFCETGAFDVAQSRRVLRAARDQGLALKVHADELAHSGGTRLAAELRAASVDHCNFASRQDLESLAGTGTVAVLLPATPLFLLAPRYADGRAVIDAGVPVALATDYNPTASISSMPFVMFLACLHMGLSPAEALVASTINAAHAIGMEHEVGSLEPGKAADFLVLDVTSHTHIPFNVGRDIVKAVFKAGQRVWPPSSGDGDRLAASS